VEPNVEIAAIDRDPSDKRYLECAVEGGASYVVSGDRHLLDLEGFEGIVILSPAAFVAVLNL
jgi:predicted nucleic acid-binding protein